MQFIRDSYVDSR